MENDSKVVKEEIIIPPLRNTFSLEIAADQQELSEIARKQLDNLTKPDRKLKRKTTTTTSDMEPVAVAAPSQTTPLPTIPEVKIHDPVNTLPNLSSPIVSKAELENEIRKKIAKHEPIRKIVGSIEIPQELILSGLSVTPAVSSSPCILEEAPQLHDQELIDILEGKSGDETEVFELVQGEHRVVIEGGGEATSYEIITDESKFSETKAKILEREIAMRQIASLPVRKNKKSISSSTSKPNQTIVQSLAAEWTDDDKDDEMILEVVNVDHDKDESKIKILNMKILNETPEVKPKSVPKNEPKILNKEAPQNAPIILNASPGETPATFKRSRIVKKKEIWDPSEAKPVVADKKAVPITLPSSITIKKLTKESIVKKSPVEALPSVENSSKPVVKKARKRTEVDKLLQDEGAVNMMYSLERENNNEDVPDVDIKPDQKLLVDKSQEKSLLVTKAKTIKNVVMKQSTSPPEVKAPGRGRAKREQTPVKPEVETTTKKTPAAACRKKKTDNCASWDYIYSQAQATCDDNSSSLKQLVLK